MPITLKLLLGISILRMTAFLIFDILIIIFLFYHPESGGLSSFRAHLAERQIGVLDYGTNQALNAVVVISIGLVLLAPVIAAIKFRSKKWVYAGRISLILLLLSNVFRIRLYSVILDVVSLALFFTKGSRSYLSANESKLPVDKRD